MNFKHRDCKIFYRYFNRKSDVVNVFLHGWGCDHKGLLFCKDLTKESCLFVDFPPFGKSEKEVKGWNVFTYANMLISLFHYLKITKFNVIGHSFGGRIAIILSTICKNEVQKLVLVDSAGLKPRRNLKFYLKVYAYKIRKKLGFDTSKFGSKDFLALSKENRKAFCSIVNTHLDDFLPFIKCKTLVIFGKFDKTTPLYMAKKLKKNIKRARLVIMQHSGHFPFVDEKLNFSAELKNFLCEGEN